MLLGTLLPRRAKSEARKTDEHLAREVVAAVASRNAGAITSLQCRRREAGALVD